MDQLHRQWRGCISGRSISAGMNERRSQSATWLVRMSANWLVRLGVIVMRFGERWTGWV